ncbi:MarR family transcriptional regulator [Paenibacillus lautus]|uniref:MarR family transcriptional regulator n=1 Tax=Paenibacillus lautus TaxID=1401 RepID=UPI002DB7AD1D|nr:MarR family transcriptional regulator [Paenibacillus lautus]MEC0310154.1 MarR family transcriptional regulator [Paenibacillus lautus]
MPEGSYSFPIYSGLLEPEHYKRIGSAIWLFLWCVSSTTAEKDEEGTVWGIVLGNKPMKLSEISERFGVNDKTVSRWLDTLENHQYIRVTRAPRGLILWVRNSKKRTDKNVRSCGSEPTEMSDHIDGDKTKMSDQMSFSGSDRTNMSDLKDIKDLTTTTPTTREWHEEAADPQIDGMIAILNAYCKLNNKLDFHVRQKEREAMGKMVAGGMPVPFTIRTMEGLLQAKREREGESFKYPTSFLYYVDGIHEAWQNSQTISPPMTEVAQGTPEQPKRLSKQQQALENLRRRAREERQREQS